MHIYRLQGADESSCHAASALLQGRVVLSDSISTVGLEGKQTEERAAITEQLLLLQEVKIMMFVYIILFFAV